ncbi:MAG: YigZ family protein [Alistipes sp.]|nr:YigZ family protein [Alistipes sp.]
MQDDEYKTIAAQAETALRERSSKFLAFAWPVTSEEQVKEHLDTLRKKYYDATHHCYAWRMGPRGETWRANDDGEPSGTAGKPILGQMLSTEITDCLVVVVRYFGGTKLGVPGLIAAYKDAAAEVLAAAEVVERTVDMVFELQFAYEAMNDVMRVVKEMEPRVEEQHFDNLCRMRLAIRRGRAAELARRLEKVDGLIISPYV